MPILKMYRFRYRATPDGQWVKARYRATEATIAERHPLYELLDVEIRNVSDDPLADSMARFGGGANHLPYVRAPIVRESLEMHPPLDTLERMLARVFLRRYVTQCARRRRYRWMESAAELFRKVEAR